MSPKSTKTEDGTVTFELEWVRAGDLTFAADYQRDIDTHRVARLAKNWDRRRVGTLYVSRRADGTLVIVDGQHRGLAAIEGPGADELLACIIATGLNVKDEAKVFIGLNVERVGVPALSKFKAQLVAGNPVYIDVDRLVRKHHFVLGHGTSPRKIAAVGAVLGAYALGGADLLDEALDVIEQSGVGNDEAIPGQLIPAVAMLLAQYPTKLDRRRLAMTLQKYPPRRLVGSARTDNAERDLQKEQLSVAVARVLLGRYNNGLRTRSKRLAWEFDSPKWTSRENGVAAA